MDIQRTVYFFFDDSGVLHKREPSGYFVYAGYAFLGRPQVDDANRRYLAMNRSIAQAEGMVGELKASRLSPKHKRALYNVMRNFHSVSVSVDISRVFDRILDDKKSIVRYKDFILKRAIKKQMESLVANGTISRTDDIEIRVNIDEQMTATDGYYSLRQSILEEISRGIYSFDYGVQHPNVIDGGVEVLVRYCDSKNNYLIQASDILANRIWTSYCVGNPSLRTIPNHTSLLLP